MATRRQQRSVSRKSTSAKEESVLDAEIIPDVAKPDVAKPSDVAKPDVAKPDVAKHSKLASETPSTTAISAEILTEAAEILAGAIAPGTTAPTAPTAPAKQNDAEGNRITDQPDLDGLKATIAELQTALAQSQTREKTLKAELQMLQTQFDQQSQQVKTLQASLEKFDYMQSELQKAQKTALQLAEANQKLTADNATLQAANQLPKTLPPSPPPTSTQLAPASTAAPAKLSEAKQQSQQQLLRQRQTAALAHPVFPNDSSPGQLSDQDIGWVD